MKTKIISVFICMLMCVTVFSVTGTEDIDNNNLCVRPLTGNDSTKDTWDLLFSIDIGAQAGGSRAGGEFDGTYFYDTQWNGNQIDKFYKNGTFVETFAIPGVTGLRDLAWDGTYMYGGAAAGIIYQMDFETKTLVGQIVGSFECRAIAYNSYIDAFYVSNWDDPINVVDRTGAVIDSFIVGLGSTYGLAFDPWSAGGPYLWVFDQGDGQDFPQYIHQWDITNDILTGVSHDVCEDVGSGGGIAGGLYATIEYDPDFVVIGGIYQDSYYSSTDYNFGYEYEEAPTNPIPNLDCSGELYFTEVTPGDTVSGTVTVENIGETGSLLNWEVLEYPNWGTWTFTPNSGTDLAAGDTIDITVEIVAPDEPSTNFTGEVVLGNSDMGMDICVLDVTLATPVSYQVSFFELLAQRFPILAKILEILF